MEEAPTTIQTNLPCQTCHYNLRTLSPTANCPECHTPVSTSLVAFQLLDRQLNGIRLSRVAYAAALIAANSIFEFARLFIFDFPLYQRSPLHYSVFIAMHCVQLSGYLLFASAFPRKFSTYLCIISSFLAFCFWLASIYLGSIPPAPPPPGLVIPWDMTADFLSFFLPLFFSLAAMSMMRKLWRRLEKPRLANFSTLMLLLISLVQFVQSFLELLFLLRTFDSRYNSIDHLLTAIMFSDYYQTSLVLLAILTIANLLLWLTTLHQTCQIIKHRPTS